MLPMIELMLEGNWASAGSQKWIERRTIHTPLMAALEDILYYGFD